MDPEARTLWFAFFNEIGILAQLSRARMEARLPDGLLLPHFAVAAHLARRPEGQTPQALARAFQVPKNTMTHTLAGLERHGFVAHAPNPADRRSKIVRLTEAGHAFREAAVERIGPDLDAVAAALPDVDLARLVDALAAIRATMDAARE